MTRPGYSALTSLTKLEENRNVRVLDPRVAGLRRAGAWVVANRVEEGSVIVKVAEAKANLSKLINRVLHGERIVIAKNNTPLVDLVIHCPDGKRKLGLLKGQVDVPEDFDATDPEIEAMFHGD